MKKNKQTNALRSALSRLNYGVLTICIVLGFSITEMQAQEPPYVSAANFYNQVDGVLTNEVTVAPGDTINFLVGINSDGGIDGVTVTMLFDNDLMAIQDNDVIDETDPIFNFPLGEEVLPDSGYFTFSKAILGDFYVGSATFISVNIVIAEDAPNTTTTIDHILDDQEALRSQIALNGNALLADEDAPSLTINIVAPVDCEDLGLNIGDACDDGDDNTENDVVTEDCECVGTVVGEVGCINDSRYPFNTPNLASPNLITINSAIYLGDYSEVTGIVSGYEYEFTGTVNIGGAAAYITAREGAADGPLVAAGISPLTVIATSDSNLFIHWNVDADCGTSSEFTTATALCVTCATVVDCEGVEGGSALPGTSCDDEDATTVNDVYDADCNCAGVPATVGSICSSALPVDCNAAPATYSSAASNGTNITDCFMGNNGLWFSFMGTGGDITVNTTATFDHEMSINSGSCEALVNVGCDDQSINAESYTISPSIDGEMYYVYVANYSSESTTTGDITIDIDCAALPLCTAPSLDLAVQDVDGNPIIDCLDTTDEYYVLATLSGGEGNSSYNVAANGEAAVDVTADTSVVLGPFTAGAEVEVTAVGAQDIDCEVSESINSPAVCPPGNDDCDNAIALTCGDSVEGSTLSATNSGLGSPSCVGGSPNDVFYTLDVVAGEEYTVSINGVDYDGVLVMYSGLCDDLTEIECADDGSSAGAEESITFTAAADETLTIRTYDWSASRGSFTISVACSSLSIDGNTSLAEPKLFPNPLNNDTFYIHAPKLNGERVQVNITDMTGRQIFNNTLDCNDNKVTVSLGDVLSSGMYLVTLKHGGEAHTFRLVKE